MNYFNNNTRINNNKIVNDDSQTINRRNSDRRFEKLDPKSPEGIKDIHRHHVGYIIIAMMWLSVLIVGVVSYIVVTNNYKKAILDTEHQAVTYSKMIASHDRFEISMAEQIIKSLMDDMSDEIFNGNITGVARDNFQKVLNEHRDRLPGIASFSVVGADGIRRFGVVGKNFTDLSNRGYFKSLKAGGTIFVSPAEDGLASGKQGIHVAMSHIRKDGSFGGLVVINLSVADIFKPYYESLSLSKQAHFQLRSSNRLIMSYPDLVMEVEPLSPVMNGVILANKSSGVTHEDRNGVTWVRAIEQLPGTSLYAQTSLSEEIAVESTKRFAWVAFFAMFVIIVSVIAATIKTLTADKLATKLSLSFLKMRWDATHDSLTGLLNRAYLATNLMIFVENIAKQGNGIAFIFIDLDKFKLVNDTHGHKAGDQLLIQVAKRLVDVAGVDSLTSRLSGDEFLIVAPIGNLDPIVVAEDICKKVIDDLTKSIEINDGLSIQIGASLGVSRYPVDGIDIETLSHKADTAMYEAKRSGRGKYSVYVEEISNNV